MSPYLKADFVLEFVYHCWHVHEYTLCHCVPNNTDNISSLFTGRFRYKYLSKLIPKEGYCSLTIDLPQNGNQTIKSFETEGTSSLSLNSVNYQYLHLD